MKKRSLYLITAVYAFCIGSILLTPATQAAPPAQIHDLTVSADGSLLAFSSQGDIWVAPSTGGTARRLTVHSADDHAPAFSPDGKYLAFSSNRAGNDDIYIMETSGSRPKQLTFDSQDDLVSQFDPNSKFILFNSQREYREYATWKVPINGGAPSHFCPLESTNGRLSRDGSMFLYQKGYAGNYRVGYRGVSATNIWMLDLKNNKPVRLTQTNWNDQKPVWSHDEQSVLFISEESGQQNIHRLDLDTMKSVQITEFDAGLLTDLTIPGVDNSFYIVHENTIMKLDANGKPEPVTIAVTEDQRLLETEKISVNECGDLQVSGDGKQLVIEHRGELFALAPDGGELTALTETPYREKSPRFHGDNESLFYVSDRSGNGEIYRLTPDEKTKTLFHKAQFFKEELIVKTDTPIEYLELTPDGKQMIYLLIDGRLVSSDIAGKKQKVLLENAYPFNLCVSPDSRWCAYNRLTGGLQFDTWLMDLKTNTHHNISQLHGQDINVRFTPDGKQLLIVSGYQGDNEIYAVWLDRADHEKYDDTDDNDDTDDADEHDKDKDKDSDSSKDRETEKSGGTETKDKSTTEPLVVDLDGIHKRVRKLIAWASSDQLPVMTADGKYLVYKSNAMGKFAVYKAEVDGNEVKSPAKIADLNPDQMIPTDSGSTVFYRQGGKIGSIDIAFGKVNQIDFNGKMTLDRSGEYLQMYREAWNTIKHQFYDENLHGADWDAEYQRFLPLVQAAGNNREFQDAVRRLIGQLNASHLGIWGGNELSFSGEQTGRLGVQLGKFDKGKGWLVVETLPDTPGYRKESRIVPGDYIQAINRVETQPHVPLAKYLNGTVDKNVEIRLFNPEQTPGIRTVTLKPMSPRRYQYRGYQHWVEQNRAMVDTLSKGRIGYLHIHSMGQYSLERFRNELFGGMLGKDAVIIDVRGNPGGNIHNELLQHLDGDRFGWSKGRIGDAMDHPNYVWRKPSCVLIDERSFSDAEVFPNGYQALGIGKVIGMPTFGGVIGTSGFNLLNGAWFRLPWTGWFTADGRNMENTGAIPDIQVERDPFEKIEGRDSQIERAVIELLEKQKIP